MTTRNLVILMICASSIAICANNNAAVRGPVTGYIFDAQAHAIRPMMGIPGAAYLGSPVVSNVDSASVSPDGSAAFAIQAGKLVVYTGLASASPTAVYLHGSIPADRFAWAPGATAAAIYSSKSTEQSARDAFGQRTNRSFSAIRSGRGAGFRWATNHTGRHRGRIGRCLYVDRAVGAPPDRICKQSVSHRLCRCGSILRRPADRADLASSKLCAAAGAGAIRQRCEHLVAGGLAAFRG